jgi:hypothetical protein
VLLGEPAVPLPVDVLLLVGVFWYVPLPWLVEDELPVWSLLVLLPLFIVPDVWLAELLLCGWLAPTAPLSCDGAPPLSAAAIPLGWVLWLCWPADCANAIPVPKTRIEAIINTFFIGTLPLFLRARPRSSLLPSGTREFVHLIENERRSVVRLSVEDAKS